MATLQRFDGRVAIVTGAGSGIGRATTVRLVQEGATVVAVDLAAEGLAETTQAAGGRVHPLVGDVTDGALVDRAVATARDDLGRLDVLVNNAGMLRFAHSHEVTDEEWDRILAVNLSAAFRFCRAAIPVFMAAGRGVIVNVASTASQFGHPWAAAYAASKGGVLALTHTLAVEYAAQGLRVNAVMPGSIQTPIANAFHVPEGADPRLVRRIMAPVGMASPDTIAGTIAFLASDDASHVNGAELRVDGATHS